MKFRNHIAYRYLTEGDFLMEIIELLHPVEYKKALDGGEPSRGMVDAYAFIQSENQKVYVVTDSVHDKLNMLKVKRRFTQGIGDHYDWTVLRDVPDCRKVFILPDTVNEEGDRQQNVLRMQMAGKNLLFHHLQFTFDKGSNNEGLSNNVFFFLDRTTGEQCDHFNHIDVRKIEEYIYRLLCFIFLSENEEQIIPAGAKHGTRKSGKIVNEFKFPLTIINSKWNITSIRTEGFGVSGHFAIRWSGEGRKVPKMVFIEPFEKHGYIRKAKSLENA